MSHPSLTLPAGAVALRLATHPILSAVVSIAALVSPFRYEKLTKIIVIGVVLEHSATVCTVKCDSEWHDSFVLPLLSHKLSLTLIFKSYRRKVVCLGEIDYNQEGSTH